VVPDCDVTKALEIDHIRADHPRPNTARLCGWHHYLKSHQGYRLGGDSGNWTWEGLDLPPG
jgi:hypothetical protein